MNSRRGIRALVLLALPIGTAQAQGICLEFVDNGWSGGNQPRGIVAAHFNSDTLLDVAMSNYETDNISVCFGNGDATFQAAINLPVGDGPTDLIAADLNNDGITDLATSNTGLGVCVVLGLGGGAFGPYTPIAISPTETWTLMAYDGDGDETLDLYVPTGAGGGALYFLHGNGDGTFATPVGYATGIAPVSLDLVDVNGDGHLDAVYAHLAGLVETVHFFSILWGTGPGTFGGHTEIVHPFTSLDAIAADVDGDEAVDVLTADFGNGTITKFMGLGSGTFEPPVTFAAYIGPSSLQLHDMNLDGHLDLVESDYANNSVVVQVGDGAGHFAAPVNTVAAVDPEDLAVGRFNADAYPDVVLGCTYSGMAYFGIVVNCLVTAVGETSSSADAITIGPNPASDRVTLHLPAGIAGPIDVELCDARGILVKRVRAAIGSAGEARSVHLDVSDLAPGCYVLAWNTAQRTGRGMVVIQ